MTTTITEEVPVDVTVYRSKIDGRLVVEIDTGLEEGEGIRILLNDGPLYDALPEYHHSAYQMLEDLAYDGAEDTLRDEVRLAKIEQKNGREGIV